MENKVVSSQAGNVCVTVKSVEVVVEVIGQENGFDITLVEDHLRPFSKFHLLFRCFVNLFPIGLIQPLTSETKELTANFNQPPILSCVFKGRKVGYQSSDQFSMADSIFLNLFFGHSG